MESNKIDTNMLDFNIMARKMLYIEQSDEGQDDSGLIKVKDLAKLLKDLYTLSERVSNLECRKQDN